MDFMKRILVILASLFLSGAALAQDYTFTNNNVVPFGMNPSLVGNANAMRFGLDYRMQWPTLSNKYNTLRITYDQPIYKQMCNIGVSYTRDNEAGIINHNEFAATYSQNIRLQDEYFVRLGVTFSFFNNHLDTDLTFDDQYVRPGTLLPSSIDDVSETNVNFVDFSFGAAFVMENKLTVGAALYHIGEPNNGFDDLESSTLGRRFVVHANYIQDMESRAGLWGRRDLSSTYFFGSLNYQQQEALGRTYHLGTISAGAMTNPILFGASYKYDFASAYGKLNILSFMVGANWKGLQAYYIFDLYTSKKNNGSWSHEFSIVYVLPPKHYKYSCPIIYW